ALRLRVAAADSDDRARALALDLRRVSHMSREARVGLLTDRARVEHDHVRLFLRRRLAESELLEQTLDPLGIVGVHLTPERRDVVPAHGGRVPPAPRLIRSGGLNRRVGCLFRLLVRRWLRGRRGVILRHVDGPALPNDGDLHLARVFEPVLDLPRDLMSKERRFVVADIARADDDPNLTSCLKRVDLLDAVLGRGELLECLETLDVLLETFAAGAGTACGDGIRRDEQNRFHRLRLDLVVVRFDGVDDAQGLAVAPRELSRNERMRTLYLMR